MHRHSCHNKLNISRLSRSMFYSCHRLEYTCSVQYCCMILGYISNKLIHLRTIQHNLGHSNPAKISNPMHWWLAPSWLRPQSNESSFVNFTNLKYYMSIISLTYLNFCLFYSQSWLKVSCIFWRRKKIC